MEKIRDTRITHKFGESFRRIPKGFRPKAQGCPAKRELPWEIGVKMGFNPNGVAASGISPGRNLFEVGTSW